MSGVNSDIKNSLQNIESYLLSHESQIRFVSERIEDALHNSLLIHNDRPFYSDVCLYSWYEATALVPKVIISERNDSIQTEQDNINEVQLHDGDMVLDEIGNKNISNSNNKLIIEVERHSLTKLPQLKNINKPKVDLDKVYLYGNESDMSNMNCIPIYYKQYDFSINQWINRPNGFAFDTTKRNADNDNIINPTVECKSFSVYEENVKFGGWPIASEDMELGMWVYTSPFMEHCEIDIPTQYVSQVQHMHRKMMKDIELTKLTNWCRKYNYKYPDFINSDVEEEDKNKQVGVNTDFIDPFPPIERNIKEDCKHEMIEIIKHLALCSSSYVAPCSGYYLKMNGDLVEDIETTFLRNKMNKLFNQYLRNDLFYMIRNRKKRAHSPDSIEKLLRLAKSNVHGFGLFAVEDIKKGEFIIEYAGILVTDSMSDILEEAYEKSMGCSTYLFRINDNKVIDATKTGNLARYVNHSCDPNAHTCILQDDFREPHVGIYASRDITPGEEIFYNYKLSDSSSKKEPCYCGSANCPGVM